MSKISSSSASPVIDGSTAAPIQNVNFSAQTTKGNGWALVNGDCIEQMTLLPNESIDLSVYSPPFLQLYVYTASERDIGNCATADEFIAHMGFVIRALLRVTKPGRHTCMHIADVTSTLSTHGVIGLIDLPGMMIRAYQEAGWIYHGRICIDKDPQAQAIRTKSKALLFVQLRKDASWLRPALADYVIVFRKPGENVEPIHPDLTNDDWIEWARPIWYGIHESDTLHVAEARGNDDERHLCALQLGTIERCIRLWSNPGELVLSPFAGIGSEGYEAIRLGRRFIGFELKPEYAAVAAKNLAIAETLRQQGDLFTV
jgi:DNA modification methylase